MATRQIDATPIAKGDNEAKKAVRPPRSARGTILAGATVVGITFFGFGAWAAYAPLASAVTASATVVSEGRTKIVQHLEGGIVSQINVREGQLVEKGDVLFQLDPVQAASRADRFRNQLHARQAQAARLKAERDDEAEIDFPEEILKRDNPDIQEMIQGERRLFIERRQSFEGQIELLEAKITQFEIEVNGLNVQEASKREQIRLINDELNSLRPLLEKGLVARSRLLALEREAARLDGEVGDIQSRRARANESAAEAQLEMEQLKQQFREEVVTELRDVETQIADLEEQLTAAEDVLNRLDIYAPATGIAQNVEVTTIGAVISPGQPLLEIAPAQSELVVAARVTPLDVHDVAVGQRTQVRFVALDLRKLPVIFGEIRSVSGDRIVDQSNNTEYFLVQVTVPPSEMKKLGGRTVHPGMPADIIVPTGSRTLMDYLLRPLADAMTRGLNEE